MTPSFLLWTARWIHMSFPELQSTGSYRSQQGDEFSFIHVEFEVPIGYPSGMEEYVHKSKRSGLAIHIWR